MKHEQIGVKYLLPFSVEFNAPGLIPLIYLYMAATSMETKNDLDNMAARRLFQWHLNKSYLLFYR
jgi:hypothetical protein